MAGRRLQVVAAEDTAKMIEDAALRCHMSVSGFLLRVCREADVGSIVATCQPQLIIGGRSEWFVRERRKKKGGELFPPLVGDGD